jgi:hypothetical protein
VGVRTGQTRVLVRGFVARRFLFWLFFPGENSCGLMRHRDAIYFHF